MQTCKEIRCRCWVPQSVNFHDIDPYSTMDTKDIVVPAGTYVRLVKPYDWEYTQGKKLYRVKPWRGMPNDYKELIARGVVLTHAQVKGK